MALLPSASRRLEVLAAGRDAGRERQRILALAAELGPPFTPGTIELHRREYGPSAGAALEVLNTRWSTALRRQDTHELVAIVRDSELVLDAIDRGARHD